MTTLAVLLAAGGGTRFTGPLPKLLTPIRGTPLVRWAIDHALAAGLDELVVVGGAVELRPVLPDGVTLLENRRWAEGQSTSLAAAVAHARDAGHDAIVVALGDQPGIEPSAWQAVAGAREPVAVATYDGVRSHPVRLAAAVWPDLPSSGDEGARALLRGSTHAVGEVPCDGHPGDVDTVEDLERWS